VNRLENRILQRLKQQIIDVIVGENLSSERLNRQNEVQLVLIPQIVPIAAEIQKPPHVVDVFFGPINHILFELFVSKIEILSEVCNNLQCLLLSDRITSVFLEKSKNIFEIHNLNVVYDSME
jgi:hypothetical protein